METRSSIPADLKRAVLVEAGHRCAIPTCRSTTTEIAHIVPWIDVKEHTFDNLIALCPNCHTRYDQKGEIDRKSMLMYKSNLSILNGRYSDLERRMFFYFSEYTDEIYILISAGADLMVANAVRDGIVELVPVNFGTYDLTRSDGYKKSFPMNYTYGLTEKGKQFIEAYKNGLQLD